MLARVPEMSAHVRADGLLVLVGRGDPSARERIDWARGLIPRLSAHVLLDLVTAGSEIDLAAWEGEPQTGRRRRPGDLPAAAGGVGRRPPRRAAAGRHRARAGGRRRGRRAPGRRRRGRGPLGAGGRGARRGGALGGARSTGGRTATPMGVEAPRLAGAGARPRRRGCRGEADAGAVAGRGRGVRLRARLRAGAVAVAAGRGAAGHRRPGRRRRSRRAPPTRSPSGWVPCRCGRRSRRWPGAAGSTSGCAACALADVSAVLTPREAEVLRAAGAGADQPADRRRALHQREDRERARQQHPGQARRQTAAPRRSPSPPSAACSRTALTVGAD